MKIKRFLAVLMCFLTVFSAVFPASAANLGREVTILFTHDMHSHLLPATDEAGDSYGGYARLQTVINQQKELYPDALLVDAGDFSMGSLFQTVYSTHASELRIMGDMGFEVTTFGNHEFDYRASGLADMLNAAVDSGDTLPQIVDANYKPPVEGAEGYNGDAQAVWDAMGNYGVKDYTLVNKNGVNFAIFGITGFDSHECAPMSGMVLEDPIETSRRIVAQIEEEVAEPRVVVCLSHSGTNEDEKKSEDFQLASKVDGIDVIVSGHTHTTLLEPIAENGAYIVSAGEYGKNLGVVNLELSAGGDVTLTDYELIPINDTVAEDPAMTEKISEYKHMVEEGYLADFGISSYDEVMVNNPYRFDSLSGLNDHKESTLGNLISDSYMWAAKEALGDGADIDFALTANGVIRESLPVGDVTVSDIFNISSLGIGADGVPGYPLVSVYITGKDLKNAFEVDASVTSIMPAAQLYFSGMTFTFNPNRMIFNKVTDCAQVLEDGTTLPIEDDELYRVVTGLYCGQMLGAVNSKSFGILNITPRDADGKEITDLEAYIIHDSEGNEVKEWYALASYLEYLGTVPEEYSTTDGRKVIDSSWNPIDLVKNANWITLIVIAVALLLITGIVFLVRGIVRRRRNKAAKS